MPKINGISVQTTVYPDRAPSSREVAKRWLRFRHYLKLQGHERIVNFERKERPYRIDGKDVAVMPCDF